MTVLDVIYELRARLNDIVEKDKGEYTNEELLQCIRLALKEVCNRTHCLLDTISCEASDSNPLDIGNIFFPTQVVCDGKKLKQINPSDVGVYYDPFEAGAPECYFVRGNKMVFIPFSDDLRSFSITGYSYPPEVATGDSLDFIPAVHQPILIKLAEVYARETRATVDGNINMIKIIRQEVDNYFAEVFV